MAKNEFLPFGIAEGANVLSNQEYERLAARFNGFVSGVAKSKELNTVWRQSSVMSSALAQFIVDSDNKDLLDNGDVTSVKNRLVAAIKQTISGVGYVTTAAMNLELNKKFDKANISGVKGNDNDKAPSLNLFTNEIGKLQPKGNYQPAGDYATNAALTTGLAGKQPVGDYATNTALANGLNQKLNTSSVVQSTGSSTTQVMSQSASTKLFMTYGAYGFGGEAVNVPSDSGYNGITQTSVLKGSGVAGTPPGDLSYGAVLHLQREQNRAQQISLWSGVIASRSQLNGEWGSWFYAYSEANTTKDPNGFIRASGSSVALVQGNISQSTGSSTTQVMSQKSTSESIIGISQAWSDLTAQRSSGTTYTNTLTKAISVSITQSAGGSTTSLEITVNNVIISNPSTSASRCFITFIVPAGATYKVIASGATISNWSELR
ncbi:hypothetical protein [Providencia alcalifaciens]|uniref:hypothetical protein n=1 Tax=Providencia alcalifaciens TaxID=126385 RepID=UPI003D96EDA4